MDLVVPAPVRLTPRSDFDPLEFDKLIWGHGTRLLWERAERCPCFTEEGSPRTDCPICKGKHWHYPDSQEVRGVVQKMADTPKLFQEFGEWGFGVVNISLPWQQNPGYHDRFTLLDGRMIRQQIAIHEATIDSLYWPVRPVEMILETAGYPNLTEVSVRYCRVLEATGVGGPLREVGVDFIVTADGRIDWTLGEGLTTAPAIGERYGIGYFASPRWSVLEHPFSMRQTDAQTKVLGQHHQPLPVNVLCRLDWWASEDEAP